MQQESLTHDLRNTQEYTHDIHTEASMREQCIKGDPYTLATARYAECIERDYKERGCITFQTACKDGQN